MKKSCKWFGLLAALMLCVVLVTVPVSAATSGTCGANVKWSLSGGTLTISGTGAMYDYLGSEEAPWVSNGESISSVVIKSGVTTVGGGAFLCLDGITSVTLPGTVTTIGDHAFNGCSSLSKVNIPSSVKRIGNRAFLECPLYAVEIPSSVTYIGEYAFAYISSLKNEVLPESITYIGDNAFRGAALLALDIPDSVTYLGAGALRDNVRLQEVYLPQNIREISDEMFYYDVDLAHLNIPDGVTGIGKSAFCNCYGLKSISIPASVTDVSLTAFRACSSLTTVFYGGTWEQWTSVKLYADEGCATYEGLDSLLPNVDVSFTYVTAQPKHVATTAGTAAKFSVVTKGVGLTYQWQYKAKGESTWVNTSATGNKTATLTIPATAVTTASSGTRYRCVITDSEGRVLYSDPAMLTVKASSSSPSTITVTSNPKSVTVAPGTAAKFSVAATGSGLKYQWQLKYVGADSWTNTSATGNKTATLTIPADWVTVANSGRQYRCKITDANGKVFYSTAATLTVKVPLAVTANPKSVAVSHGKTAKFSVTATGSGLKYQWQYKNASGNWVNSTSTGYKTATLSITAATAINGRQYRCKITDSSGKVIYSGAATLTVRTGITVTGRTVGVTVAPGVKARFSVTASGTNLKYQWQYRNAGASAWTNSAATGSKTATLTVATAAGISGRQYRCKITDSNGNAAYSEAAKLTVSSAATVVKQTRWVSTTAGVGAQFKVDIAGSGLTYQWQYKNANSTKWANSSASGNKTATLTIAASGVTKAVNNRQYRCIIKDAYGGVIYSTPAGLTVK